MSHLFQALTDRVNAWRSSGYDHADCPIKIIDMLGEELVVAREC